MRVFCPALLSAKYLPSRCAGTNAPGGQNLSLPISWMDVPPATKSFAVSMVDSDSSARGAVHWLVVNIPGSARNIPEGASNIYRRMPPGSVELRNRFGNATYNGPILPKGTPPRDYRVTLYALKVSELMLGPISPPGQFEKELQGRVIDQASVVATYCP